MIPTTPAAVLDGTSTDGGLVGGKGAALARLVGWGLPVPAAGAVTTDAYREIRARSDVDALIGRIRAGAEIDAATVDGVFLDQRFSPDSHGRILALVADVAHGGPVAVRSSATVEDLAESSFVGQYRSVLDVDPADDEAVLRAVLLVFASLWHPAPCAYRRTMGIDDDGIAMAAVVMAMVPAERAGVVFTTDPGGAPSRARIEVVEGVGEALVSGRTTPEVFVVERAGTTGELPEDVRNALELAMRIEDRTAEPQDVEWAWDGERLWIVQARPITVTADGDGFDSEPGDADLTTLGIAEMLPGVLPPLRWQLCRHLIEEAFRRVFGDLGVFATGAEADEPVLRRVRGRAALDFDRLKAMARRIPGGTADELEEQYFGSRRPGRPAVAQADRGRVLARLRHDRRADRARRRAMADADVAIEAVAELAATSPDLSLPRDVLMRQRAALLDLAVRAAGAELGVAAAAAAAYRRVELILIPHVGEDDAGRLVERVTASAGIMAETSPHASMAVFAGPTWAEVGRESPTLPRVDRRDDRLEELETLLRARPSWGSEGLRAMMRVRTLRRAVDDAIEQLHRREATKAALLWLGGEVRGIHLELGRRLADDGLLEQADDIELLTERELRGALDGRRVAPPTIRRRARWNRRYEAARPLPARFSGRPVDEALVAAVGHRMDGWAASPGSFAGVAQVVHDPTGPFDDGRVLVAQATDASWSPLFVRAGAIVLERGGPLSHASILARELGVPAVLNVAGATHHLDGQEVTVDGDAGVVLIHDDDDRGEG